MADEIKVPSLRVLKVLHESLLDYMMQHEEEMTFAEAEEIWNTEKSLRKEIRKREKEETK